ncbi:lanthionine synthetase LanC family protein [Flavitalea sp. BT771]|uniref:lanthionine synthetase LanC family protein n=1 Tax=Flavitalea sp. BT771 TaxID=3063329 RepID=UPI0026E16358|nr:lanthionine synthetase LanC family protein [Flavitalea sp. BT771]MDO6434596.1 lanthionine synthetase LanC family protein [Flavitalea sp. BT771]MDV6223496.1 lanthionine synthetase LanC family protein [Flavitalea sp. BT771]
MLKQSSQILDHCLDIGRYVMEMQDSQVAEHGLNKDLFFILELYKNTHEPAILANLLSVLEKPGLSSMTFPSRPGRPCYGRSGLASLYFELFNATGRELYLEKALELGKQYLHSNFLSCKTPDNYGMADGMAGTMLLYLSMYAETEEGWLMDYIRQCLTFLVDKAVLTGTGIYWTALKRNKRHTGWDRGSSGIACCFLEIGRYCHNSDLYSLADKVLKEEDEYLRREMNNAMLPVHLLTRLYASLLLPGTGYGDRWNEWIAAFPMLASNYAQAPTGKLADEGLAYKEAYCLTKDPNCLEAARTVAAALVTKVAQEKKKLAGTPHDFNSLVDAGYFLLKMTDLDSDPSLLLPRLPVSPMQEDHPCRGMLHKASQGGLQSAVNAQLLQRYFRRSFPIVKKNCPDELSTFLSTSSFILPEKYEEWVRTVSKHVFPGNVKNKLEEAIDIEMAITRMRSRPEIYMSDSAVEFSARMDKLLALPVEDFLNLQLILSDKILLLKREPVVDLTNPLTPAMLSHLFTSYGRHSYYCWGDDYMDFKAENLGTSRIFTDIFTEPRPVYKVLNNIVNFILSQEEKTIAILIEKFSAGNKRHLQVQLNYILQMYIKSLLMKGVLVVVPR